MLKQLWMKLFNKQSPAPFAIAVIKVAKHDVIVISTERQVCEEQVSKISGLVKGNFPDNPILFLSGGLKIAVIRKMDLPTT